jgi:hypothetical protein
MMSLQHRGSIAYFDDQAPGAWANGTRIIKVKKVDAQEVTDIGTRGTVLGSMGLPADAIVEQLDRGLEGVQFGYFIEWDDKPNLPTFCIDAKLALENS